MSPTVGDRVVALQTETAETWYALDTVADTTIGGPSDVYVGSCHFGKSQCFMDLDTSQTTAIQYNDLNIPSSAQDRVDLMPRGSGGDYYARLRSRLAVSLNGVCTMHAAIGQFVNLQTAGTTSLDHNVVTGSTLTSTDPSGATYVTQQTSWLLLDLFQTNPTWGGYVSLLTWTDDPYQAFLLGAEITVIQRPA